MENKQTGWVPDFPDVKDYTLRSKQVRKALQPIQATQIIGSLESQKESVLELLEQIVKTTKEINKDKDNNNEEKGKSVESLYKKLEEGMGNEVILLEAKLLEQNPTLTNENKKTGELLDIERIPSKVFNIIVEKFFKESGSDLLRLKGEGEDGRLIKVVYPIVKVITQILTPIGEHGNLSKAVTDKGIKYFKSLFESQLQNPLEKELEFLIHEIKELKKATERNHNFSNSSLQSVSSWKSDNEYFEYLAYSAILKAKEELIAIEESLGRTVDKDDENYEKLKKVEKYLNEYFDKALEEKDLPFQKAMKFDGTKNHVERFEWQGGKPVTVEFWMKVNKDEVESEGFAFSASSEDDSIDWDNYLDNLFQAQLSNDLCLYWYYGNLNGGYLVADYSPYLNQWTHVALVSAGKGGNFMGIYLNGELVAESQKSDNPSKELQQLQIGNSWKGEIAKLYIWQGVRSPEQIRDNMFQKNSGEKPKNYWSLDEVTNDDIVNNNNNPNNTVVSSGDTKPKIVTIEKSLSKKWVTKKNFIEGLGSKKQTRFNIMPRQNDNNIPHQNDNDWSEGKDETNYLQFVILKKHLEKITAKEAKDTPNLVGLTILPDFIDLSLWCSEIEDQGSLNSCTASAAIALMEYFQKKSFGKYIDGSRLFLYKATRNLMQIEGNVGTSIRNTMKAMALFGVPPEEYWPYDEAKVNVEPNPFCYSFAQS